MTSTRTVLAASVVLASVLVGCTAREQRNESPPMKGSVQHLSPDGLHRNPAYSQAVAVTGNMTTVYVGGQNAVDTAGRIVGKGDIKAQTEQVLRNVETALAAGGAKLEHVIKWNVHIVQGQPLGPGFEAFQRAWGDRPNPPIVTMSFVSALASPDFLVEIEAVAVVPQK
jgi:enamine deaminase RidA (YjgF/YER057c/UK114 family)